MGGVAKNHLVSAGCNSISFLWPRNQFNRVARQAGLSGGPHTLRHYPASHFLAHCPDIYLLARVLGHSDVTVTRLYAHLLPDHLAKARNVVGFV